MSELGQAQGRTQSGQMSLPDMLQSQHDMTKERFSRLTNARSMLETVRTELQSLVDLGDIVKSDDVVKVAGNLVAKGLTPMAVAKLLSDMPEGGQALQSWLQGHEQDVTQREQQLAPVLESHRHALGVQALRVLMGHAAVPGSPEPPFDNQSPASGPARNPGPDVSGGPDNALGGVS